MGVLLMLMTIGGLIVAGILLVASLVTKKAWLAKFTIGGAAIWFVFYVVMLLAFSLTSEERILGQNEAKEYCGFYLDCHMHTEVSSIRTAQRIGDQQAKGIFYIVGVHVFSDAKNPRIAMRLIEPKARILTPDRTYIQRDTAAEAFLPTANVDLGADIHSSQTIDKEIVFDVERPTSDDKLLITDGYAIDKVLEGMLVGDEDSLIHAQTFFALKPQTETANVR
jgi:hypothetical protein